MISRLAFALAVFLVATQASAENVRVLSGEHDNFSRIVLVFRKPIEWTQARTQSGFAIEFDRTDLSLDLSRVFELIPRDRIRSVVFHPGTSSLELESGCGCGIEVFLAGKNTVAIDISSPPESESPATGPISGPEATAKLPFGLLIASQASIGLPAQGPDKGSNRISNSPEVRQGVPLRIRSSLAGLEGSLMKQLGRAASQGLIAVQMPEHVGNISEPGANPASRQVAGNNSAHVLSGTVFDEGMSATSHADSTVPSGTVVCLAQEHVDPTLWVRQAPPGRAIGRARADTLDDLGTPVAEAVERLATTYLGMGFGAEAQSVLEEFPSVVPKAEVLIAIAGILDEVERGSLEVLLGQEGCDGPSAIWGVLASPTPSTLEAVNVQALQEWFFRFPPHLRQQIGPKLARNLLDAGWPDAAFAVRNATRRATLFSEPELVVLEATTELSSGTQEETRQELTEVLSGNDQVSAEALVELLSVAAKSGRIDPEDVLLAEAMAVERSGSPGANELLAAAAIGRASLGEFDRALLDHRKMDHPDPAGAEFDRVLSSIVRRIVQFEDDAALLRFVQRRDPPQDPQSLTDEVSNMVVGRLLDIDLWEEAHRVMSSRKKGSSLIDRQLSARILLDRGDPSLALTILAGKTDAASLTLRAVALSDLEDHESASRLHEERGDLESAMREAWLSGAPDRIRAVGTVPEMSLVGPRQSEVDSGATHPDVAPSGVSLGEGQSHIHRSQEMRKLLATLLDEQTR